jgi:hypothetical protein
MPKNLGSPDRLLRLAAAVALLVAALVAPLGVWLRLGALAAPGAYLLVTALAGTCLGYTLMGRSTCRR